MSEYFSIELKIGDREGAAALIQRFTQAMAEETLLAGNTEVIACGWGDKCGSMTACDAYEAELRDQGLDPDEVVEEFLEREGLL